MFLCLEPLLRDSRTENTSWSTGCELCTLRSVTGGFVHLLERWHFLLHLKSPSIHSHSV